MSAEPKRSELANSHARHSLRAALGSACCGEEIVKAPDLDGWMCKRCCQPCADDPIRYRMLNGEWQVYGEGLLHVCMCINESVAKIICDALNAPNGELCERRGKERGS